jgi:hypothetical protein
LRVELWWVVPGGEGCDGGLVWFCQGFHFGDMVGPKELSGSAL